MTDRESRTQPGGSPSFEEAAEGRSKGVLAEFWAFLRANKKWWLLPLLAVLMLVGGLIVLSSTALAPFIYTLF